MTLSDNAIVEFQDLCEEKFKQRPSYDEAKADFMKLLRTVQIMQEFRAPE